MSKQVSSSTMPQEKLLLNPFEVSDDQILERIYITHFHCVEKYDVGVLYSVASNVIKHSIEIADMIIKDGQQIEQVREETDPLTSFQRLPAMKRIACQMMCTARGEQYAHQTTMLILEQLRDYSWDAKAVIVLAAFALEFGKFWQLAHIPRDKLGQSLAELNGLQSIMENIQHLANFNNLVKKIVQVVKCITDWKKMITAEYNVKDVPSLTDTLHEIPVLAYWTISTLVTCTSHIDFLGDKGYRYDLSKFDYKLDFILKNFKDHQDKCSTQIGQIEDYSRRKDIITSIQTDTQIDIVKFLEALIIPSYSQDSRPIVYNGLTGPQVALGEFKNKHVLLFISGLDHIDNEIQLLKSINAKLKEEPNELEGYRKEDFKILWIPIVSVWDEEQKKKLDVTKVEWYVVKEFNFQTGIDLIKEVFNYKGNPIIMLISPEGKVENSDAKQIISKWGIDGFPFRTLDHTRLTQQWNWFWNEMITLSPIIRELIKRDSYIFIYGGTNTKWIQDFTTAVEKLKKNETLTLEEETTIESYPLGRDSPKIVPRFWITIDNLLASRKLTKKGSEQVQDSTTREIQKLMFLKQDPLGWAILTKGSHVKLLGHGDAMLRTVTDFESWKGTMHNEVSFDVAFKNYYDKCKVKSVPPKCEHREFANYPTDILAHIPCPNKCGHEMEVSSVKYMCCHGREASDIA
ncbi:protein SIEVE ELEMENT OCCLUSION B-like [Glycine soja]|uniref:Protein SIEVE ELEMENT OCCLUSION B n=1 Tax=Glycine soja TaxID=3848 RepID=A0A445I718_GLYSO|nr:protein SIEVE ELEMENT OCCLUSION B-like [Glycine soja]KHN37707.1 Putative nucleoredoxin 3 [Glycine soja]RZB81804.1 Protein SIEVE ELEMENT OCCLUSION B [Glycine soja]